LEKLLYENLELCVKSISDADVEFTVKHASNNEALATKIATYVISHDKFTTKLNTLTLSATQEKMKKYVDEAL